MNTTWYNNPTKHGITTIQICSDIIKKIIYLLIQLRIVIDKSDVVWYRDDGLVAINNASGAKLDRIRKDIIASFKKEGLSITIKANPIKTGFLDVTFNLATENTFIYNRLTISHSKSTFFLTTRLKGSTKEFQINPVIRKSLTKLKLLMKNH